MNRSLLILALSLTVLASCFVLISADDSDAKTFTSMESNTKHTRRTALPSPRPSTSTAA